MNYLSVSAGIEAASVAWEPLGFKAVAFSEIDPFCNAVLAQRFPGVPNLGDMTKYGRWKLGAIDILVGGTPCQSFSVAGLRKGLDDPRGNLMLTYLAIAKRFRPTWLVWENVPGVLSSNGGRDFGTFLGGLGELGYGFAYRVLDAQYFGVAQRRRRVFVVGYLGDWRCAAAVLFERESLSGNPPPSRETGKGTTGGFEISPTGGRFTEVAPTMDARAKDGPIRNQIGVGAFRMQAFGQYEEDQTGSAVLSRDHKDHKDHKDLVVAFDIHTNDGGDVKRKDRPNGGFYVNEVEKSLTIGSPNKTNVVAMRESGQGFWTEDDKAGTLRAEGENRPSRPSTVVAFTQEQEPKWEGGETTAHTLGTYNGRKQAIAFQSKASVTQSMNPSDQVPTLGTTKTPAVAFNSDQSEKTRSMGEREEQAPTLRSGGEVSVAQVQWASGGGQVENNTAQSLRSGAETNYQFARVGMTIRRLTPRECERLQGFPDDFTLIKWNGKPATDGRRYKALGNSMAVPVMRWIGERIKLVNDLLLMSEKC